MRAAPMACLGQPPMCCCQPRWLSPLRAAEVWELRDTRSACPFTSAREGAGAPRRLAALHELEC